MKKTGFLVLVSVLVTIGLLVGGLGCAQAPAPAPTTAPTTAPTPTPTQTPSPSPTQPKVIKWNMQAAYPFTSMNTVYFAIEWIDWVKDITDGRLQIELHPPGTFATGSETMTAVGKGVIDASLDYSGYYGQKVPVSNIESGLPLAWHNYIDAYDAYFNRGLFELIREAYAENNVLNLTLMAPGGGYHFGTTFPFTGLDSIKGKKIRATGVYADYVKALGGNPVVVSGADLYMSLKTGIIDGMIFGMSTLEAYKLAEVITDYVESPAIGLMVSAGPHINMDSWNALPDDIKHLLEVNSKYFMAVSNANYEIYSRNSKTWSITNHNVKYLTLSPEDQTKALNVVLPIWDEMAKTDARNAKAVAIIKQQMKDYGRMQ